MCNFCTLLISSLQSDCPPPRHPETNEPIDRFRERIDHLIQRLDKDKEKIIIPTPALSEILVRTDLAGPEYLDKINSSSVFRPAPFDERGAVEVAAMTRKALDGENGKRNGLDGTYAKIKYDRQIVAIAKVEGAKTIYSDDRNIYKFAGRNGITVVRIADLPLPPEEPQHELGLEDKATEDGENEADTIIE